VSDLQCPARILVARHGEAMYADPDMLSDEGGWLTDLGKEQAADLGERLRGERVARSTPAGWLVPRRPAPSPATGWA
jgi:probable phosphoglycerate mutase